MTMCNQPQWLDAFAKTNSVEALSITQEDYFTLREKSYPELEQYWTDHGKETQHYQHSKRDGSYVSKVVKEDADTETRKGFAFIDIPVLNKNIWESHYVMTLTVGI